MTYQNILSCWHKLEHFNPATLPKGDNVILLGDDVPWEIPLKSKHEKKRIEYTIFIGVFHSMEVIKYVKKYFKDETNDENQRNSLICSASIKVEESGKFLIGSFGISTLPWALGQLENDKIKSDRWKNDFTEIEEKLNTELEYLLITKYYDEDGTLIQKPKKISKSALEKIQSAVADSTEWSVNPELKIYIKAEEKYFSKNSPEEANPTEILNSFYINDLEFIIADFDPKKCPKPFLQYLDGCLGKKSNRTDLSRNPEILKESLLPENYPDGCWPSKYTPSLMQQYAVNEIFNKLSKGSLGGISSVNGPPGTGKTTLLRDIIAPILVARAKSMIKFDDPRDAFTKEGSITTNGGSSFPIYSPEKTLRSGGIVVASSNNGAVENISKELPQKKEVSDYADKIGYFKEVSELCINKDNWGIISAVLGNSENRNKLISDIWFSNKSNDLQKTLREASVTSEEWESLREEFKDKLKEVHSEKQKLKKVRNNYSDFLELSRTISDFKKRVEELEIDLKKANNELANLQEVNLLQSDQKQDLLNELLLLKKNKPGFFVYWFNRGIRKNYQAALKSVLAQYQNASEELKKNQKNLKRVESEINDFDKDLTSNIEKLEVCCSQMLGLKEKVDSDKSILKENYADNNYWQRVESPESQTACPWYSDTLKKLQSELFILAMKVNESFVLLANQSPKRITTTLIAFFEYLKGDISVSNLEAKSMWETFFLVIPVVSTTFASVTRMFKGLSKDDLPWLFIDESGQAIPQAAIGSIWRSKRVVVVGDPLQIEPVVTIPKTITNNFSQYFGLTSEQINADLSVQSMADRSNPLGAYLKRNGTEQWIGIPLRVHRRCLDPMFKIANSIAYANSMYSVVRIPDKVRINFRTEFIDCKGQVEGRHFVPNQAAVVLDMLTNEIDIAKVLPDIFVISPFLEIAYKLNEILYPKLFSALRKYDPNYKSVDFGKWLRAHVGTVHTFQGKQAEGVILCLGLDDKTKGAANWASQKPNLLNVALTRAKYRFVAIGDSSIWLNKPYFKELRNLGINEDG